MALTLAYQLKKLASGMSSDKRGRSVANSNVSIREYGNIVVSWMDSFEGAVPLHLGPYLAKDQRGVTPSAVVRLSTLLSDLLDAGLTNAMLLPKR